MSQNTRPNDNGVGTIYVNLPKGDKQGYLNISIDLEKAGVGTGVVQLVAFKNTFKTEQKHPDYRIMKKTSNAGASKARPAAAKAPASNDDSGLPF